MHITLLPLEHHSQVSLNVSYQCPFSIGLILLPPKQAWSQLEDSNEKIHKVSVFVLVDLAHDPELQVGLFITYFSSTKGHR